MGERGRKSAAALTAPAPDASLSIVRRPDAPLHLTPDEAEVWREVVDDEPADWFSTEAKRILLAQYCRHAVTARRFGALMDQEMARDEIDVAALKVLADMQAKETGALKAMAASMRLSHQASYDAQKAATAKKRGGTRARPWES
jgi:hypothetical protein